MRQIENELAPARAAVAALIQENVSGIDVELGRLSERQRQITRLKAALKSGEDLKGQVDAIQAKIEPLQEIVDTTLRSVDFQAPAEWLAEGMNAYLARIDELKPGSWSHSPVSVTLNTRGFDFRVGKRRWSAALGGSDTLYFLMAYHYGLLSLSDKPGMHYPGLSIIGRRQRELHRATLHRAALKRALRGRAGDHHRRRVRWIDHCPPPNPARGLHRSVGHSPRPIFTQNSRYGWMRNGDQVTDRGPISHT